MHKEVLLCPRQLEWSWAVHRSPPCCMAWLQRFLRQGSSSLGEIFPVLFASHPVDGILSILNLKKWMTSLLFFSSFTNFNDLTLYLETDEQWQTQTESFYQWKSRFLTSFLCHDLASKPTLHDPAVIMWCGSLVHGSEAISYNKSGARR